MQWKEIDVQEGTCCIVEAKWMESSSSCAEQSYQVHVKRAVHFPSFMSH